MLTKPTRIPWFADYFFRFEGVRSNGDRTSLETKIRSVSEGEALKHLRALLGDGRYDIAFLGIQEIPMKDWPLACRLGCGLDKHGNRPATPAVPTPKGGVSAAKDSGTPQAGKKI